MRITPTDSTHSHSLYEHHPWRQRSLPRIALLLGLLTLCLTSGRAWSQTCTVPSPAPNIIFILFDDLGWGSIGSEPFSPSNVNTPEIDAWAANTRAFRQFYVNAAICSPTRTSVLSGSYPQKFNIRGALENGGDGIETTSEVGIPEYVLTLPELLSDQGYRTVHIGKWHTGDQSRFGPDTMGFDEWAVRDASRVNEQGCGHYWDEVFKIQDGTTEHTCPQPLPPPLDTYHCEDGRDQEPGCTNFTDWQVDRALATIQDHIAEHSTEPLFLNLWMRAPHSPFGLASSSAPIRADFTAPSDWIEHYDGAFESGFPGLQGYAALVSHADDRLGDLLNNPTSDLALETFLDNTIVFLFSDNGAKKTLATKKVGSGQTQTFVPYVPPLDPNSELHSGKGTAWEGGTRVPMLVRWPDGGIPQISGSDFVDFPFTSFDLLPTIADLLCLDLEALDVNGQTAKDQLLNPAGSVDVDRDLPLFWEHGNGSNYAVRDREWKYVKAQRNNDKYFPGNTSCAPGIQHFHLFDMSESQCVNPGACEHCEDNQVASEPELQDRYQRQYIDWRRDSTRIDWGVGCADASTLVGGDGQVLDFGSGGWVELCGHEGASCVSDHAMFNFHDQSFTFSINVRPDVLPSSGQVAWIAGREDSWELTVDDAGLVELFLCEHEEPDNTCQVSANVVSNDSLTAGEWSNITFAKSGYRVRMWIDGSQQTDDLPVRDPNDDDIILEGVRGVASSNAPVLLGAHDPNLTTSWCSDSPSVTDTFAGAMSHPRLHTAEFGTEERTGLRRTPIRIDFDPPQGGANVIGDVFEFPNDGLVKLRGDCAGSSCQTAYPLFDFGAGSFTFGIGIKPDSTATSTIQRIAAKGGDWKFDLLQTGQIELFLKDGSNSQTVTSAGELKDDTWSHVAFTIEENPGGSQDVKLWIDGVADSSTGSIDAVNTNSKPILLGANFNGSYVKPFKGSLSRPEMDFEALDSDELLKRARLEIDSIESTMIGDVEVLSTGVIYFDRAGSEAGGAVELCAPADFGTCEQQHPQFDIGNDGFTFSLDLRPAIAQSSLAKVAGKPKSWGLWLLADNRVRLKVCEPTNCATTKTITSTTTLPAGEWSNVAFTIEPIASNQELRLYVDGVIESDSAAVSQVDNNVLKRVTLGAQNLGGGNLTSVYKGAMRYLRMYARVIDPADVIADP